MPSNLSYPHVEFNTVTIGSIPQESNWRDAIGVVGQFRRGPSLNTITSASEFNKLYGADNSPGSRAVRMMLDTGINTITISRAVSEETSANTKIAFYGLGAGVEAKVGFEGSIQQFNNGSPVQTTGLKLEANYIGKTLPSLNSIGTIEVDPTSKLNPALAFSGQSLIQLGIEERIANTIDLTTLSTIGNSPKLYSAIAPFSFVTGATGTLTSLNANLTPIGLAVALVDGDRLALPNGGSLVVNGTNYTVIVGASLIAGSLCAKAEPLTVTNALATLGVGSKLYYNNIEVATIAIAAPPTNITTTIYIVPQGTSVPLGSLLKVQAVIGAAKIELAVTPNGGYQFARISKTLYPAVLANLKPGRVFQSKSTAATFESNSLTILSRVLPDPNNPDYYNFVVKGGTAGAPLDLNAGVDVELYDTPFDAYTVAVSTTANLGLVSDPSAIQWRNQLYRADINTLVDSYEIVPEAYAPNSLKVNFLFLKQDGTLEAVDSGIKFTIPQVENSGVIALAEGSNYRLPLVRAVVAIGALAPNSLAFQTGISAAEVLSKLELAILQDTVFSSLFETPVLSKTLIPTTLTLETKIKGDQANRVYLNLSRSTTGEDRANGFYANDLLFNSANVALANNNWSYPNDPIPVFKDFYCIGASAGSRTASLKLYSQDSDLLVTIFALSDGGYGNQIEVSISPGTDGQFVLNLKDLDSGNYQATPTNETLNLSTRDVDAGTGLFNATKNSSLIRAYYAPLAVNPGRQLTDLELSKVPLRVAPAYGAYISSLNYVDVNGKPSVYSVAYQGETYLQNISLTGGADAQLEADADPANVGARAMIRAVQRLEALDIAVLYPAGVTIGDPRYASVVQECIGQVNRNSQTNTNRRLVLQAPPNLNVAQANLYGAQLNNEDITLVAGWCTYTGISSGTLQPSSAIYAAALAKVPPPQSMAYVRNGLTISGVSSVDVPATPEYLDALTRAGVEALFYDSAVSQFHFLNGRNTARDPNKRLVSIRRVQLQILVDLYQNLVYVRSQQNDDVARALVASSCDAYLSNRVATGWIKGFTPTISDGSNNDSQSEAQGYLNATIRYTQYFPADILVVDVIQDLSLQLN
jgi:hypothetical protein